MFLQKQDRQIDRVSLQEFASMHEAEPTTFTTDALVARIAALELALAAERAAHATSQAKVEELTKECDHLRASHERLRQDLELLRRRIFIAKAERVDSSQLEMEFAQKLAALDELAGKLFETSESDGAGTGAGGAEGAPGNDDQKKVKPKGRRDLSKIAMPEERVEISDPVFEDLVRDGKAKRFGFEESYKLAWQRGGHRRTALT